MNAKLIQIPLAVGAVMFALAAATNAPAASLFERRTHDSLIADRKAQAVGDLVTIIIKESSTASTSTSVERTKDSSTDASITTLFWENSKNITHKGDRPKFAWESARQSSGEGSSDTSADLETQVTARVIDVQPNGNLLIEATREVEIYGSAIKVVLTGLVRPDDITANNTVESTYIADAKITYEGPMAEVMKRGLLERLMDFLNIF